MCSDFKPFPVTAARAFGSVCIWQVCGGVGINLLREGLDVPEVSLVCIFDADKPGFFRNDKALIQTFGRAGNCRFYQPAPRWLFDH